MIKQNDSRLRKEIQLYGCNLLAHLAMVRQNWLPEEIELIYQQALARDIIDENCTLKKPQELLQLAGSPLRQIGSTVLRADGKVAERWEASEDDPRVKWSIVMYSQRGNHHKHFTLHNRFGEVYDPYDPHLATYALRKQTAERVMTYG